MTTQLKSLEQRIRDANQEGRIARVPFLTAGFPTKDRFLSLVQDLDAHGADIIEIGIPFSDPVADGPVVEDASRRALENGVTLHWIIEQLKTLKPLKAGLVLMGYYNPFLQYGLEKLARDAQSIGVQGLIVPDLPLGESSELRSALTGTNIDLITLVGPNTDDQRMQEYAQQSSGYVYVVSVMGTTGVRSGMSDMAAKTLERAKKNFTIPVALGFGIQNPDQLAHMSTKPDAAVFGSALLKHIDAGETVESFMKPWAS